MPFFLAAFAVVLLAPLPPRGSGSALSTASSTSCPGGGCGALEGVWKDSSPGLSFLLTSRAGWSVNDVLEDIDVGSGVVGFWIFTPTAYTTNGFDEFELVWQSIT